jgi:hypothetical protein
MEIQLANVNAVKVYGSSRLIIPALFADQHKKQSFSREYEPSKPIMVDFPEPLAPTNAVVLFAGADSVSPFRTLISGRAGYEKSMFSISILPTHSVGTLPSSLSGSISDFRSIVLNSSSAAEAAFVSTMIWGAIVVIAVAATMTAKMTVKLWEDYQRNPRGKTYLHLHIPDLVNLAADVSSNTLPESEAVPAIDTEKLRRK